ncbi:MAG: FAD:protein FMN transferase [Candidatus Margulisiibacteriota bacterium]|nr:FAD:protein FMN transferase [Candidatus Margulisiibacteriota bacterium]
MRIRPVDIIIVLLILVVVPLGRFFHTTKSAYLMGTPIKVRVDGYFSVLLSPHAIGEVRRLEGSFGSSIPEGEIGLVNSLAGLAPIQVSEDTFRCVEVAMEISRLSGGAFDITLGHSKDLILNSEGRQLFLKRKGVKIDLGAIGKGYAADHVRRLLLKSGAKSGMIDMRSTIAVFGKKRWKIGIQHPRKSNELIGKITLINGQSLSTSGDYERGGHIIDPRSGKAADMCQSVTVVGHNAAETDALSTAVFVLGPRSGLKLIGSLPGYEALIIDKEGAIVKSSGFNLEEI